MTHGCVSGQERCATHMQVTYLPEPWFQSLVHIFKTTGLNFTKFEYYMFYIYVTLLYQISKKSDW